MSETTPAVSGIVVLDKNLVDQLYDYLEEKENELSHQLVNVVHPLPSEGIPPDLLVIGHKRIKLSDALEAVSRRIRQVTSGAKLLVAPGDWEVAVKQSNSAFWEHVEILESCSREFFLQLGQLGLEEWHSGLREVVDAAKEIIMHRIEDTLWAIKRMENNLWDYRWACMTHEGRNLFWQKLWNFRKSLLDPNLSDNLHKCERFLQMHYSKFIERFQAYRSLEEKIIVSLEKLEHYAILGSLESVKRDRYRKIYSLLKLWGHNLKANTLPKQDLILALKYTCSAEKAFHLFQDYYKELQRVLFNRSRALKEGSVELYQDADARKLTHDELVGMRAEVRSLASTVTRYREFMLRTDPNPYVRSRWGFAEGDIGQEPAVAKQLSNFAFEVEHLDRLFARLEETFEKGPPSPTDTDKKIELESDIDRSLHEIGQPLISRNHMRSRIEQISLLLLELDELGSFSHATVSYVRGILSKVLKVDWRYHVFHEVPQFHEAYAIHHQIASTMHDRVHNDRLRKFEEITHQILHWVKEYKTALHEDQIDLDISDIKGYLQDFLGTVQRLVKSPPDEAHLEEAIEHLQQQLLEYRYLFSEVFYQLLLYPPEGVLIRQQFLCVDHYFESVDALLADLRPNKRRRNSPSP